MYESENIENWSTLAEVMVQTVLVLRHSVIVVLHLVLLQHVRLTGARHRPTNIELFIYHAGTACALSSLAAYPL